MFVRSMQKKDFLDFASLAAAGCYSKLKYASTKEIRYTASQLCTLNYKLSFGQESIPVQVLKRLELRSGQQKKLTAPQQAGSARGLAKEKIVDLTSLMIYMQGDDLKFMTALLKQ